MILLDEYSGEAEKTLGKENLLAKGCRGIKISS
jgi:hypothetical protein